MSHHFTMSYNKGNGQNKLSLSSFFSHPLVQAFLKRILFVKKQTDPFAFFAKCLLYVVFVIWGLSFFDETNFALDPHGAGDSFSTQY